MASSSARRSSPQGRTAGAALLAPNRPLPAVVEGSLVREARASVALDSDPDMHTHYASTPEIEEVIELEEVTIEPDLPMETESPEDLDPVDLARLEYQARVAAMGPDEPVYVAGNRAPRLKLGDYTLCPGDVVPGAHSWPRRETYERLGRIERR